MIDLLSMKNTHSEELDMAGVPVAVGEVVYLYRNKQLLTSNAFFSITYFIKQEWVEVMDEEGNVLDTDKAQEVVDYYHNSYTDLINTKKDKIKWNMEVGNDIIALVRMEASVEIANGLDIDAMVLFAKAAPIINFLMVGALNEAIDTALTMEGDIFFTPERLNKYIEMLKCSKIEVT